MKTRHLFAALAATFLVLFQGCQTADSPAPATEAPTNKETGALAFRLSPQSVDYLRAESYSIHYSISGPDMDSMVGEIYPDTSATILWNVPSGTRIIQLRANNFQGVPIWYGADTVLVTQGQATYANITLKKLASPTGTVVLNISLDSTIPESPLYAPFDTIWGEPATYYSTGFVGTYNQCGLPAWYPNRDSIYVQCKVVTYLPVPGDTSWVDTVVPFPVPDTAKGCVAGMIDSSYTGGVLKVRTHWTCHRYTYVPVEPDTTRRDTTVHTRELDGQTWCRPVSSSSLNKECLTGRYKSMSADRPFMESFSAVYETTNLCETIFWGDVIPVGIVSPCSTDSNP